MQKFVISASQMPKSILDVLTTASPLSLRLLSQIPTLEESENVTLDLLIVQKSDAKALSLEQLFNSFKFKSEKTKKQYETQKSIQDKEARFLSCVFETRIVNASELGLDIGIDTVSLGSFFQDVAFVKGFAEMSAKDGFNFEFVCKCIVSQNGEYKRLAFKEFELNVAKVSNALTEEEEAQYKTYLNKTELQGKTPLSKSEWKAAIS